MPWRAPKGLLLFLMAAAAAAAVAAAVVPGTAACAPPCAPDNNNNNNNNNIAPKQCLHFLQESHKDEVCGRDLPPERRRKAFTNLRLRHCCEHRVLEALPETAFRDTNTCRDHLQDLLEIDELASQASASHSDLLMRYDCTQNYSIIFTCDHCKVAYRRWICSSLVPFYGSGVGRIPPCLHFCQDVEQQCPYLLPDQTLTPSEAAHPTPQYAGEPNFLCLDLNIPRLEPRPNSTTGDEDCCYTHCGAPGRGSHVCAPCSGRAPNDTRSSEEDRRRKSTITTTTTRTTTTSSGMRTSSFDAASRWMCWTLLLLTLRLYVRFNDLFNCLIGTVNSVRTVPGC